MATFARRTLFLLLGTLLPLPARAADRLLVFAAASLTDALTEIGREFAARTGIAVDFSFGASSDLERQIEAGAPAQVFLSADTVWMDRLERAGYVRRSDRREFLSNSLCVVVPSSSPFRMRNPRDLLSLSRIALADPAAVPAGIYARRWLESEGLWRELEGRVIPTLDVRAALAAVESEAVPAGIVYKTDAAISKKVRPVYETAGSSEIVYSVAPLVKSGQAARLFVDSLSAPQAVPVFQRRGFLIRSPKEQR